MLTLFFVFHYLFIGVSFFSFVQEGKKVHTGGGFSGKGFKFDENEALAANEKKKIQKAVLGSIKYYFMFHGQIVSLKWKGGIYKTVNFSITYRR